MKAIIFDLDNCLCPGNAVGEELLAPVFNAIRAANGGSLPDETLRMAFQDIWKHAFDWVAEKYAFTPEMFERGWSAYAKLEVRGPMQGYPDLQMLAAMPAARFLVTSGFRRLQESKIDALGIRPMFEGIYVDAIDEPKRMGKRGLFQEIMAGHRLGAADVLVIGDNPESEIRAGNTLGLRTVQILRPGVQSDAAAAHHISSLSEVFALI